MKRAFALLMAGMLVLTMGGMGAAAAGRHGQGRGKADCAWVDENGDGICDNRGPGKGQHWVDEDGDGICDNRGSGKEQHWVDEDGDGICDNWGIRAAGRGAGKCQVR